jgi:hypothetical protein
MLFIRTNLNTPRVTPRWVLFFRTKGVRNWFAVSRAERAE